MIPNTIFDFSKVYFESIPNYSSGIRVGELCHLHCGDIRISQKCVFIARSKNRSERYAILSEKALRILVD
ncbi:MAG: site-specific integrase [Lachnospiraceae bacterium]|nr:site-specific integrase [Lachnospiraceae bacterium]